MQAQYSRTTLLYLTLVRDGALPSGFQQEFESLASAIDTGAERALRQSAKRTDTDAVMYLHFLEQKRKESEQAEKTAADQFIQAASLKPRRFRARYMSTQFDGPSARKDSEEAERSRWISILSEPIKGTATPMGMMLTDKPGQQLVGGGRRASTLRSRVRGVRKFLTWLALNRELSYPTSFDQLSEFLQVRLSEPCNRGALKGTHQSFVFLEEMVGTPAQERLTGSALYGVIYRELLASAQPGRPTKQAPRILSPMLSLLEQLVMDVTSPMYLRVYSWWMLLQNWATLRFSDHRGLNPSEVVFREGSFHARLTRSKTIGQDKTITSKPLVVDASCFLSHREWLTKGWSLLQGMANFPRDYLMPAPASHCQSCRKLELRYDAAFAIQNKVLRTLARDGVPVFHSSSTRFWTPHSGRTFLPSATAALGFPKSERDFLGGWCAQASDRYARIAIRRITNMQRAVIKALQNQSDDPLAEEESIRDFDVFMEAQSLDAAQRTLCFESLDSVRLLKAPHGQEETHDQGSRRTRRRLCP